MISIVLNAAIRESLLADSKDIREEEIPEDMKAIAEEYRLS